MNDREYGRAAELHARLKRGLIDDPDLAAELTDLFARKRATDDVRARVVAIADQVLG